MPAWRGVVFDGEVWAWPTLLFDHNAAFVAYPTLGKEMTCRWRQWEPGGPIDFDREPPASDSDIARVRAWVHRNGGWS